MRPPATLAALVPDYLPTVPRDFTDGEMLRYRLHLDGTFTLYSVGNDAQDSGGDPGEPSSNAWPKDSWEWGVRDWVWPQVVRSAEVVEAEPRRDR